MFGLLECNLSFCLFRRFKWSLIRDFVEEDHLVEDFFAAVKTDGSIEIYSISKTSEDFSSSCDAVVGKDLLKGLLHDRGKGRRNLYTRLLNSCTCLFTGLTTIACQLTTDEKPPKLLLIYYL